MEPIMFMLDEAAARKGNERETGLRKGETKERKMQLSSEHYAIEAKPKPLKIPFNSTQCPR
jgi:hypothetical protein